MTTDDEFVDMLLACSLVNAARDGDVRRLKNLLNSPGCTSAESRSRALAAAAEGNTPNHVTCVHMLWGYKVTRIL